MGGVNDRHSKPTSRFDSRELARLTKKDAEASTKEPDDDDDPFKEWDVDEAVGTPKASDSLLSRTATVHDPLTTGLLAEVARRSQTTELAAEQVDEAQATDPSEPDAQPNSDAKAPAASPRLIKR